MSPATATPTRLGDLLIARGLIQTEDVDRALELQKERGDKLGRILMDMGYLAQKDLLHALSDQLGLPIASLATPTATPELEGLSPRFLRQSLIFPMAIEEGALVLAMAESARFRNHQRGPDFFETRSPAPTRCRAGHSRRARPPSQRRRPPVRHCRLHHRRRRRSRTSPRHGERSSRHSSGQRHDRPGH